MKSPGKGSSTWGLFVYSCLSACLQTDHFTKSGERKKIIIKWKKKLVLQWNHGSETQAIFCLGHFVQIHCRRFSTGLSGWPRCCITCCFRWEALPSGRASRITDLWGWRDGSHGAGTWFLAACSEQRWNPTSCYAEQGCPFTEDAELMKQLQLFNRQL